jgi:SAM-dependent methyltransferase
VGKTLKFAGGFVPNSNYARVVSILPKVNVARSAAPLNVNYTAVEEVIKADYRQVTPKYRADDEIEVTTENHRRLNSTLQNICESFPRPIAVLDAGCGTGRYFHCLTNVEELIGVDISDEMLQAAENPVRQERITARNVRLLRANVHLVQFARESFHFIYSLGMFGNGCPLTVELCNRFYHWLLPGGKLFFNVIDYQGLPLSYRLLKRVRRGIYGLMTRRWQRILDEREARHPFFNASKSQLEDLLCGTEFREFAVASRACKSPLSINVSRHLECVATKG